MRSNNRSGEELSE